MTKHLSLFAIVFGVALGLAYGPPADATPLLEDTYADAAPCRLQDDRECLQVLKRLAAAGAQRRSAEPDFYAVLVNGDTSPLHNANVERAYHVLRALSVPDNNIHVLSNSDPRTGHDAEAGPRVNARATTANLANVLGFLAREVDDNDCLLVYTTGHGIREQRQSALCLNDGLILEDELVRYMRSVRPAVAVVLMDQCFSGGFADALERGAPGVIAIANTDSRHETYCEYFATTFWTSLLQPEADMNGDGRVSLDESFELAMAVHRLALADSPEETHGRMVDTGKHAELAVNLEKGVLAWEAEPKADSPDRAIRVQRKPGPEEPQLRRSRVASLR